MQEHLCCIHHAWSDARSSGQSKEVVCGYPGGDKGGGGGVEAGGGGGREFVDLLRKEMVGLDWMAVILCVVVVFFAALYICFYVYEY